MDFKAIKQTTFQHVPEEAVFWAVRGDRISTVRDLINCMASLSEEQWRHHVSKEKNDVANWVLHVLKNPLLAKDLQYPANVESKEHFLKTLRDHVTWLETV